ncbi:hypothetical protein [Escherichia coli]|uniref:hypothetical protein n=1 Tax=Escherichia coli TaxID=562 RepID=UPI000390275F|nr:hypothetical protein [Escherichia coli]EQR62640.1 hypothetical protein G788_00862 [Escherichia coli HVH 128 (4-7030436)]
MAEADPATPESPSKPDKSKPSHNQSDTNAVHQPHPTQSKARPQDQAHRKHQTKHRTELKGREDGNRHQNHPERQLP